MKGAETLSEVGGGGRPGQQGFLIRLGPKVHGAGGSGGVGGIQATLPMSLKCFGMALYWRLKQKGLTQVLPCGPKGLALPERPQPEEAAEDSSYKTQINLTLPC